MIGTLPWGWHEDRAAPVLPNVGEHDDLTLSMAEHDAMRAISAHWEDEVPCMVTQCDSAAVFTQKCWRCAARFLFCRYDRELVAARQASGVTIRCHICGAGQPSPLPFDRL